MLRIRAGIRLFAAAATLLVATHPVAAQDTITVWWGKGFYKSEDDALLKVIKKFEEKTGTKVELSQYAIPDMIPKTVAALDSGTVPDVAYSDTYDLQAGGKWAFEGKLEDLSDILVPMKIEVRAEHAGDGLSLQRRDQEAGLLRFSAEAAEHACPDLDAICWRQGRLQASDIPTRWNDYWSFWCDKVQPAIRKATGQRIYGIGQPMGVESTDSFESFFTFMDAYNVKLVDDDGKLTGRRPKMSTA